MSAVTLATAIYPHTNELVAALQARQLLPPGAPAVDRLRITLDIQRLMEGLTTAARENLSAMCVPALASAFRGAPSQVEFPIYDPSIEIVIGATLAAATRAVPPAPAASPAVEWSPALNVAAWGKIYGLSRGTVAKRLKEYEKQEKSRKDSRQAWRIVLSELTPGQREAALEKAPSRSKRSQRPALR